MGVGVPRIWTLKDETKLIPTDTEADIIAVEKIRSTLPQDTDNMERLPWFTYVDEAMLVAAGLIYDKEFDLEANDEPPTWGINLLLCLYDVDLFSNFNHYICCFTEELMIIASVAQPVEVDFDAMLGERPSFFDRMKMKPKKMPRKSMVPTDFKPAAPLPISSIPERKVNSILKRIPKNIPSSTSHPSKRTKRSVPKKFAPQVFVCDFEEGAAHSQGSAHMGPVALPATLPAATVDLTSSTTLSDPAMGPYGDQGIEHLSLQVVLSQPFPPQNPSLTIPSRESEVPEEEFR
ncbi:hypothetical protein LIER_10198 [Lithospermum erythrorhizon]|uniref:Uncharacterized protein n=1 Tax=Lithospermum erythrorhizon TaxID=34254 RepID=A0AAV3PIC1_LITER